MLSRKWVSLLGGLTPVLLFAVACSDDPAAPPADAGTGGWTGVCVDIDGDGYGFQCERGSDCNDSDNQVHVDCQKCTTPSLGCTCVEGTESIECSVTPVLTSTGTLLCKEGTRYCRDGKWTDCEGIVSFEAPAPAVVSKAVKLQGLIKQDAAVPCGPCTPDCYQIEDPIDPPGDGGVSRDAGYAYTGNGGITLGGANTTDAAVDPDAVDQVPPCDTTADTDCDGIPNVLDQFPLDPPFESDHATIFMDLAAGEAKSNTFDLRFFLKTADIYFLLDMTGSMDGEKANLISSLKTGNWLDDPATIFVDESADIECADRDFNGTPDQGLKTQGIAGNIACLIRNSGFGTGLYREIPFSAADTWSIRYTEDATLEAYEHRLDITSDVDVVDDSLNTFITRGNKSWAESGGIALNAIATGGPVYMGWDRAGIPKRTCPAGRFGYPCFRNDAMPIVVLVTDAPIMNGPAPAVGNLGVEAQSTWNRTFKNGAWQADGKQPVNYDALGLRYMSKSSDGLYHPVSGNEGFGTAYDIGAIDGSFKTYTGDTRGMSADVFTSNMFYKCSSNWPGNATTAANAGYPDAVFKFSVTTSKPLTISTRGTRHKPTLAILPIIKEVNATVSAGATANPTPATAFDLGSLTSQLNVTGDTTPAAFNDGELTGNALSSCLSSGYTHSAPDAWFKFTVPQNVNGMRFTVTAIGTNFNPVLGLFEGEPTPYTVSTYQLSGNDVFNSVASAPMTGNAADPGAIDNKAVWFTAGNTASPIAANYPITNFNNASWGNCTGMTASARDAVIDFRVAGNNRTLRVETTGNTSLLGAAGFNHVLAVFARPAAPATTFGNTLLCNRNGITTNKSLLEGPLNAGNYSLVVKGEKSTEAGTFGLVISDRTEESKATACANGSTGTFTSDLKAGVTYYLGMRGRTTGTANGRGTYAIRINNSAGATAATCRYDNATYQANPDDTQQSLGAAEVIDTTLPLGDYYAVVKGRGDLDTQPPGDVGRGWYQITFGDRALGTENLTATMPTWGNATSGTMKSLLDQGIRVITVTSTKSCVGCSGGAATANAALQEQADIISRTTKAITASQNTRGFDIYNNGSGLGYAVVNAIAKLTANVSMDVSVRFVPLPETPAKPFIFSARAIDVPGDLCSPPIDTNADGVVDTHKQCAPGAVPRFQVTFKNPAAPNNVPVNPAPGSNGGYNMRIELIGDGKYVIDQTPVFIIPQAVLPTPPKYLYDQTGSYSQDIAGNCPGTDRPNWQSLAWNDTLPKDTSLQWRLCAGDSAAELDLCQTTNAWRVVATVTPGASCTSSSQCGTGYCSSGTCHHPVSPAGVCAATSDCGINGVCGAGGTCGWTANPISLLPALKSGLNGKTRIRLQVNMTATPSRTEAPSVQDFKLTYVCSPGV